MANSMVNMDLPFNPAKLQQRIGVWIDTRRNLPTSKLQTLFWRIPTKKNKSRNLSRGCRPFLACLVVMRPFSTPMNPPLIGLKLKPSMQRAISKLICCGLRKATYCSGSFDGAMDGKIREVQSDIHAAHSRLYMIYQAAFEALGMETSFSEEQNVGHQRLINRTNASQIGAVKSIFRRCARKRKGRI